MTSTPTASSVCAATDTLCIIKQHELEVIIVPALLLFATLVTLVALCFLRYCPERKQRRATAPQRYKGSSRKQRHSQRNHLAGIDAPPGLDALEHEQLPMSVQQVQLTSTERQRGAFGQVSALPLPLHSRPDEAVGLHRARMSNRGVILRVLKETASARDKQHFLGFASFVSELGPHPFLPELVGVVSAQPPLTMVVEELQHGDLLGFLWRCREGNSPCDMTEKRIFTMAGQVASALEHLHGQSCVHGNVGARSILVGDGLTAKLWGLGSAYRRRVRAGSPGDAEDMELRKWQAPEVLARRNVSQSSDVWSFGVLLHEMVTLGDPPFAQVATSELLQHLQRGKHLKRPANCSNSLFSIIKSCCHWNPQHRLSVRELISKLQAGEKSANGRTVLRASQPVDVERYLREAGYGEAFNYAVL